MSIKKKVFTRLKPKAASFGFNREELMGIAESIADNLDSEDKEATDEDIDAQIDAVLPILKVGQQQANRVINSKKPATTTTTGNDDDDDDDNDASVTDKNPNKKNKGNDDQEPTWFKAYREQQDARLAKIEGDKVSDTRRKRLEKILKDSGKYGERVLKSYSRMKFETDDEFEDFISEVEEDLEDEMKEEKDDDLSSVSRPIGKGVKNPKKEATDADIDAIVANM